MPVAWKGGSEWVLEAKGRGAPWKGECNRLGARAGTQEGESASCKEETRSPAPDSLLPREWQRWLSFVFFFPCKC